MQHEPLAGFVARDPERPGADDLGGIGVDAPDRGEAAVVDVRREQMLGVDRRAERAQERREGHGQADLDGVVVGGGDGHPVRLQRAVVGDVMELEGSTARRGDLVVVDDPVEREVHVVGRERLPVVPGDVAAEVEGPGEAVLGTLPGFGQGGLDLVGQPGGLGEPLEEVAQHVRGAGVSRDGEVERERLGDGGQREAAAVAADAVVEPLGVPAELGDESFQIPGRTRAALGRRRPGRGALRLGRVVGGDPGGGGGQESERCAKQCDDEPDPRPAPDEASQHRATSFPIVLVPTNRRDAIRAASTRSQVSEARARSGADPL